MTEKLENLTRANVMSTSTEDNEGWIYQIKRGFRQKGHMTAHGLPGRNSNVYETGRDIILKAKERCFIPNKY